MSVWSVLDHLRHGSNILENGMEISAFSNASKGVRLRAGKYKPRGWGVGRWVGGMEMGGWEVGRWVAGWPDWG